MRKSKILIERLTVTGKYDEAERAVNWCYDNGYRIIRNGPVRISAVEVDVERFKIVAEREVSQS